MQVPESFMCKRLLGIDATHGPVTSTSKVWRWDAGPVIPRGTWRVPPLQAPAVPHPMMNAPVVGVSVGIKPQISGESERSLISAAIGGNWKLSVPVGFTEGPQLLRRLVGWLLESVVWAFSHLWATICCLSFNSLGCAVCLEAFWITVY